MAETSPRKAIEALKVINLVFERGRELDMCVRNPAEGLRKPEGYKANPHRHWTGEEIETFLSGCKPVWRRAVMILLYTGLRRDDAIHLERRHIINDRIYLTKDETDTVVRKTGAEVIIPLHPKLRAELAEPMPVAGVKLLITGTRGKPIRGDVLSASIKKEAKRIGIEAPPPLHGLRKNAVMRLIEVGLSKELIKNITGQSEEMIEYYGQSYNRERLVEAAEVLILEDARKTGENKT